MIIDHHDENIIQNSLKSLVLNKEQTTLLIPKESNRSFLNKLKKIISEDKNMKTTKTLPTHKIQIGALSMTLWMNEIDSGVVVPSVTLQKRYFDKDDKSYKDATSFNAVDLPVLALISNLMCQYIVEKVNIPLKTENK